MDMALTKVTSGKGLSWKELNSMEVRFLALEQDVEFLYKQATEVARFNNEVRVFEHL